ncbi:MAG: YbbR-like domain-containing protein [Bacteroidetes bacterium]|uniref:YbbR-like domain-containing protein n=1 Tax=Candidatus Cryptobacteroides intestinigallinarum TaxID=2840767 RepID=A0A9D9HL29_9BACT|nr:YbbR-like domain-containing protein [Candidatus Cryptobacteroides intestinigallinarum]
MKKIFNRILESLNFSGRDWTVFLLSLLLAFSIWLIHNLSLKYTEFLQVPVRVKCEIEGHSNMSSNTADVVARCQTTGYSVIRSSRQHSRNPLVLQVDPQVLHYRGGETFYMTASDLQEYTHIIFGENASVEYFLTDTLFFRFPYEEYKKVPVSPVHILRYAPQYIGIGEMSVEPDSVVLYGEPSHLENIDRVMTEAIRLNDINSNIHGTVRLERVSGVRMSSETVHYSQMVTRYVEVSSVVSIQKRNVPQDKELMIYPSTAEVLFRCIFPMSDDLTGTVRFYVDYNDFMKSLDGKCLVRADRLPPEIISYEIRPKVFDCVVNEKL